MSELTLMVGHCPGVGPLKLFANCLASSCNIEQRGLAFESRARRGKNDTSWSKTKGTEFPRRVLFPSVRSCCITLNVTEEVQSFVVAGVGSRLSWDFLCFPFLAVYSGTKEYCAGDKSILFVLLPISPSGTLTPSDKAPTWPH